MQKPLICSMLFAVSVAAAAQTSIAPPSAKPSGNLSTPVLTQKLSINVQCPATITVQATNTAPPWLSNAVLLNIDSVILTNQPIEIQQMVCRYKGSGYEWAVMQPIRPTYKSCAATGKSSFSCTKA